MDGVQRIKIVQTKQLDFIFLLKEIITILYNFK